VLLLVTEWFQKQLPDWLLAISLVKLGILRSCTGIGE